ncbi:hypothetical protein GCM10022389_20040 [Flavobacterium cheonanense]|uniref:Uncharacterized protein n=1 Tax=Flavobacterium cheonanense TaxID=706183 RepID=A0ABP7VTY4_9FLAO
MTKPKQLIILEKSGYKIIAEGPLLYKYLPERYEHTYTLFNMRVEDTNGNIVTPIIKDIEVGYILEISAAVCMFQGYTIVDNSIYFETHSRDKDSHKFYKITSGINVQCSSDELKLHIEECKLSSIVDNQSFSNYIYDLKSAVNNKDNLNKNEFFSWVGENLIIDLNK